MRKLISIVTPCFNEEDNVEEIHGPVVNLMAAEAYDYEIIFIDNASTDQTVAKIKEIAGRDKNVKLIVNCRCLKLNNRSVYTKFGTPPGIDWHVAIRPGKRKTQKHKPWGAFHEQAEQLQASVRPKVEHPFGVIKRQFGYTKVRYRGLAKNTAQLITLFALSNIWMARSRLMQRMQG